MSAVINTNITSLIAQNNLSKTQDSLQLTIQRLSSGLRVNTAADDASGFAIANRMDSLVRGMAVASRNANDGISYSQTTTGALSQISNNLQRMRELAVQAANGSNSASDTSLLNQEFNQLQTEVNRIQQSTTFNGVSVFQNKATVFQIGFGTTANDRVNMSSNALVSSQALGTATITDSTATSPYLDIASAVSTANVFATTTANSIVGTANQIAYIYNATVDAVNSNQKLSFCQLMQNK
jgi:flagellin